MTIKIQSEKEMKLSSQDVYDICDFATQAAYDNGFMNQYIFERALYVFTAIILHEELELDVKELQGLAASNINAAWTYLLDNGIIENLYDTCGKECDFIALIGKEWFDDYKSYIQSARGILTTIQDFTGGINEDLFKNFTELKNSKEINQVLETAQKWGMNNTAPLKKLQ